MKYVKNSFCLELLLFSYSAIGSCTRNLVQEQVAVEGREHFLIRLLVHVLEI